MLQINKCDDDIDIDDIVNNDIGNFPHPKKLKDENPREKQKKIFSLFQRKELGKTNQLLVLRKHHLIVKQSTYYYQYYITFNQS